MERTKEAKGMSDYTLFHELAKEVQPPDKGILSRTLFNDDRLKAVVFGFAHGPRPNRSGG